MNITNITLNQEFKDQFDLNKTIESVQQEIWGRAFLYLIFNLIFIVSGVLIISETEEGKPFFKVRKILYLIFQISGTFNFFWTITILYSLV